MSTPTTSHRPLVRKILRGLAALTAVAIVGIWAAKGAHTGWSQNRVPINQRDEITGIDYVIYEERFVPGLDTLGLGLGGATALLALSFFFRSKNQN